MQGEDHPRPQNPRRFISRVVFGLIYVLLILGAPSRLVGALSDTY